ncbi:MAG: threonine synthase [Chloroflexi bacterium]|nr:threonine synthase [Chloroflexota bacterium]
MDHYICPNCHRKYPIKENHWECKCGSILELEPTPVFDPQKIRRDENSLWRYAATLPVDAPENVVTMGEGWTPLEPMVQNEPELLVKLEYNNPTGSYKDRGVTVLVSKLKEEGVKEVVEDSSGNAGAALAAYAARARILCHIYVPASHSTGKMRQIAAYGADLVPVQGSRKDTSLAAIEAARKSYYASHAHSPLFVEGCKTMAYELWEQMDGQVPGIVFTPLGQGSILLGLYKGFKELYDAGYADRVPRLVGVQAQACAPLANAFQAGADHALPVEVGETSAEGIKIADPVRGKELLAAMRDSQGDCLAVSEEEIALAKTDLAHNGFYVEATSAVTLAGYRQMLSIGPIPSPAVLILTGSGLKSG